VSLFPSRAYFSSLKKPLRALRPLVAVTRASGVTWLAVPFYVVAARRDFGIADATTAWFVGAHVVGALVGNVVGGWMIDRHGSRRMILACVVVAALTPAVALLAPFAGWQILAVAAGLTGATTTGKAVGYESAVLELVPTRRRPSYVGTYAFLTLPVAFMPLLGGAIASASSYETLFGVTTAGLLGAVLAVWRWSEGASYPRQRTAVRRSRRWKLAGEDQR